MLSFYACVSVRIKSRRDLIGRVKYMSLEPINQNSNRKSDPLNVDATIRDCKHRLDDAPLWGLKFACREHPLAERKCILAMNEIGREIGKIYMKKLRGALSVGMALSSNESSEHLQTKMRITKIAPHVEAQILYAPWRSPEEVVRFEDIPFGKHSMTNEALLLAQ
jgi:hypothetical protein